jgi:hypothetical protein
VRLKDFWDGFVQSKGLTGFFFSPRKVNLKISIILAYAKLELLITRRRRKAAGFIKSSFEIPACRKPGFGQS